jgi:glycosyltransferase involved in cell wall biosynthesis
MPDAVEKNVSVIIKTFERRHCVIRLYHSIRKRYPNIPILIADDSKEPLQELGTAKIIALPYNCGLSHGRNELLTQVTTKYFVLADDDFVFTKNTNLLIPYNIMECTEFSVVGIKLLDYGWKRRIYRGSYDISGSHLWQLQGQPCTYHMGYPAYHFILNCFMAKTEAIKASPWDKFIKIGHEHDDFFLRLMEKNILITHTDKISIDHYPEMSGAYQQVREKTDAYKKIFLEKHDIQGVKEKGKGYPYWQRKLDSFIKFVKIRGVVNKLIKHYRLKQNGLAKYM